MGHRIMQGSPRNGVAFGKGRGSSVHERAGLYPRAASGGSSGTVMYRTEKVNGQAPGDTHLPRIGLQ